MISIELENFGSNQFHAQGDIEDALDDHTRLRQLSLTTLTARV
jgi:hypothetical protein